MMPVCYHKCMTETMSGTPGPSRLDRRKARTRGALIAAAREMLASRDPPVCTISVGALAHLQAVGGRQHIELAGTTKRPAGSLVRDEEARRARSNFSDAHDPVKSGMGAVPGKSRS